ncbi:hypothetical protein D3C83_156520 [compost metagenome]
MNKPAFVFDGRNVLPHDRLRALGFHVHAIGKPVIDGFEPERRTEPRETETVTA